MNNGILIVDDEANIRLMLRTCLETDGFRISEAADGTAALALLARETFDLLVLDLWMPPPDGLTLLQRLHDEHKVPGLRVIVLTAHGSIPAAVQALKLGALDFLEKPITPETLRRAVARAYEENVTDQVAPEPGRDLLLWRVRTALRLGQYPRAEAHLLKIGTVYAADPEYLNLVGVFHEAQGRLPEAKTFYGKAVAAHVHYQPAQRNLQRLYELEKFGRSEMTLDAG